MNKLFNRALVLVVTLLLEGAVFSTSVPNNDNPVTFLGPTIKARFTNRLVEDKAYSLLGEAGVRNLRIGGTYGWKFTDCQRLKFSAEYLWQNITYAFYSGNDSTWVNQIAGGLDYQWDLALNAVRPQIEISAYASHAPSKSLGYITGSGFDATGLAINYTNERRVAGSNAMGAAPGFSLSPWIGSRVKAMLNYDNVDYNTKFNASDNDTSGWGGTLEYDQLVTDCLALGVTGAIRKPFNYYDVNLSIGHVPFFGVWTLGVFGSYTDGKHTLPDTYNVGITADYVIDQTRDETACFRRTGIPVTNDMLAFVSTPAVYMPQVLAIADNLTTGTCGLAPVVYLGTPNADPGLPATTDPFNFSFAPLFAGANIVYSLAVTVNGSGSPSDFSINPNTGLLSYAGSGSGGDYNLTITGSNACSSASVSFNYVNED